jgi:transcriptional regulator with PAS, ATPase and Fis domain
MDIENWTTEFPAAITVCDTNGIVLALNEKAATTFAEDGGLKLIGTNLLDCHPEPARSKVMELLRSGERNVYTIEKNGTRKLIYQSPWYKNGQYAGFVEMSLPLPDQMPHFVRQPKSGTQA